MRSKDAARHLKDEARVVLVFDSQGIRVESNGVNNPTQIAMLEMAKELVLRQTLGPELKAEAGTIAGVFHGRKVDE